MLKFRNLLSFDVWFFMFAAYLLVKGLVNRENSFLTAESGLGYSLGIVGGSMMLVLLLYPLRKHVKWLRSLGPIRYWFRIHMLLGVAGPVLILYHANFGLGSTNSNIALFCMLTVAGSGLFGRIFYRKIHDGLYGRKIQLGELKQSLQASKQAMDFGDLHERLDDYEHRALKHRSILSALMYIPWLRLKTYRLHRHVKASLRSLLTSVHDRHQVIELKQQIDEYFERILRLVTFSIYERLFSLWHIFHIPLFIMMIISGIIHVFAVHIY